jgi:hypothetical protein
VTGAASAFLAPGLFSTTRDFTTRLGGAGALAAISGDSYDDFLERLLAFSAFKFRNTEFFFAAAGSVGCKYGELHYFVSSIQAAAF